MNLTNFPPAAASPPVANARPAAGAFDDHSVLRTLRQLRQAAESGTASESAARIVEALQSLKIWDYLAQVTLSADSTTARLDGLITPAEGLSRSLQAQLTASGRQAIIEHRTLTHRAQDPAGWIVATSEHSSAEESRTALVGLSTQALALKPPQQLILESAAREIARSEVLLRLKCAEDDLVRCAAVVDLMERLSRSASPGQLDRRLVTELGRALPGCRIMLGRRPRVWDLCKIVAVSEVAQKPRDPQAEEAFAGVMDEALLRRRLSIWPPESPGEEAGLLLHRQYVDSHPGHWLVSLPLAEHDSAGTVILVVGNDSPQRLVAVQLLNAVSEPIAAVRETVRRAHRGTLERWRLALGRALSNRRAYVWLAVATALAAVMFIPVTHRIECECGVEPVVRKFVTSPFAAPLAEVLVRPGDDVAADQVLARLDGREIRWELAGVTADLQRASRERDGHMALHDSGEARLSELEMERLRHRTSLLEHRTRQLEIRSPLAGLVISGDLDQAIGAPLEIGQTMFELAPLDQLVVELKIPEREISYAQAGQPVRFWLESQSHQPRVGSIIRITPRAEILDGESVFVAEVALENRDGWLRPGMHGTARIDVGECRLGWKLFHRAWEEVRIWIGI